MGNATTSQHQKILNAIRSDNAEKLSKYIKIYNIPPNSILTKGKGLIHLCAMYGSVSCLTHLLSNNYDINIKDAGEQSTPLIYSSKFDFVEISKILLSNNCDVTAKNNLGLNALDISVLRGNYRSAYLLLDTTSLNLSPVDFYKTQNAKLNFPMFNIDLFYNCLIERVPYEKAPSFANVGPRRKKPLPGMVQTPNDAWGDVSNRLGGVGRTNPSMATPTKIKNRTIHMKVQGKLLDMAYGDGMVHTNGIKDINIMETAENNKEMEVGEADKKIIVGAMSQRYNQSQIIIMRENYLV